jgi:hypothetical protein
MTMTRDELVNYLGVMLSKVSDGPPRGPRPSGTFIANPPRAPASGLRVVTPDGMPFYVAVYEGAAFDREEDDTGEKGAGVLTVGKLFEKMGGLPPDTNVVVGIIEEGRHNALDAMPEIDYEPGQTLLYILCEQRDRPWPGTQPSGSPDPGTPPSSAPGGI